MRRNSTSRSPLAILLLLLGVVVSTASAGFLGEAMPMEATGYLYGDPLVLDKDRPNGTLVLGFAVDETMLEKPGDVSVRWSVEFVSPGGVDFDIGTVLPDSTSLNSAHEGDSSGRENGRSFCSDTRCVVECWGPACLGEAVVEVSLRDSARLGLHLVEWRVALVGAEEGEHRDGAAVPSLIELQSGVGRVPLGLLARSDEHVNRHPEGRHVTTVDIAEPAHHNARLLLRMTTTDLLPSLLLDGEPLLTNVAEELVDANMAFARLPSRCYTSPCSFTVEWPLVVRGDDGALLDSGGVRFLTLEGQPEADVNLEASIEPMAHRLVTSSLTVDLPLGTTDPKTGLVVVLRFEKPFTGQVLLGGAEVSISPSIYTWSRLQGAPALFDCSGVSCEVEVGLVLSAEQPLSDAVLAADFSLWFPGSSGDAPAVSAELLVK